MELISKAAAIECAIDAVDDWDGGWNPNRETVIRKYFEELPAVDAAPVVHARWTTKRTWKHDGEWYCSACEYEPVVFMDSSYCPNCGAKMDKEADDGQVQ